MSSAQDLSRFLDDLGTRRARLLRLAEPGGSRDADLVAEMVELSEQLIVADEELRVQQEALESARRTVVGLCEQRDQLLADSTRCFAVTDARGVVGQIAPAMQRLIRQPPIRLTPRPIATWFEVADRRAVRAMVSAVTSTGEPQRAESLTVRNGDGEPLVTDVAVERMPGAVGDEILLRWEFQPTEKPEPAVRLVPPAAVDRGDDLRELVGALSLVAAELAQCEASEEMFPVVLDAAVRLIPGTEQAGLTLLGPRDVAGPTACSGAAAQRIDAAQLRLGVGPLVDALTGSVPVQVAQLPDRLASDVESPDDVERSGAAAMSSAMAIPLISGARHLGALTVYAYESGVFGTDAEMAATALAGHAGVALARAAEVSSLRAGLKSREVIGGAIGVLVERHRITPEAAFALLSRQSQETNVKLREIARIVLETGQDLSQIRP